MMDAQMMLRDAIDRLRPGASFVLRGPTLADLDWQDENQAPPQAQEIAAALDDVRLGYLLGELAARRWKAESGGTLWNGWNLPTDDRSQAKYLAELAAVNENVRRDGQLWKFDHGFEPLTNQQVREMAVAARNHVLACFAKEAEVAGAIAKGIISTAAEIDAAFAVLS